MDNIFRFNSPKTKKEKNIFSFSPVNSAESRNARKMSFMSYTNGTEKNFDEKITDCKTQSTYNIKTIFSEPKDFKDNDFEVSYSTLNDGKININLIAKITKCEKLKSEILLKDQKSHYSLKKSYQPTVKHPESFFYRYQKEKRKTYTPTYQYNKNNIYAKKSPVTNGFRSTRNNYCTPIGIRKNFKVLTNLSGLKKNLSNMAPFSSKSSRNTSLKKGAKSLERIKKIQLEAYNKNVLLRSQIENSSIKASRTIENEKPMDEEKSLDLKKYKVYDKGGSVVINLKKLLKSNGEKVKFRIDPKSAKYVDSVVNQVIYEDEKLNKYINENTEFQIKSNYLKLDRQFKQIANENLQLKRKLHLDDFYSKPKKTELQKIKEEVLKLKKKLDDPEDIELEVQRANVMKILHSKPKKVIPLRAKKLCKLLKTE